MEETSKVYRVRTNVGDSAPSVLYIPVNQTYDTFEILSLKLNQSSTYKLYESDYGVLVGRVYANGGFGVPNAKVSIFIEFDGDLDIKKQILYNFTSTSSTNFDGVRYNLLPDYVDDMCHQNVGTFPNKRLVLDNNDVLEIFEKYWKYTTVTNHAGDYMIFGVPSGSQQLHVDVDLSDCGILSQRPRDMMAKGYNATQFESPNKFKSSTNLNSLAQIIGVDKGVFIYPYWGDTSDGDDKYAITRCDISLDYKFEPYCVFMGSIMSDTGTNAIGKNCSAKHENGKMSDLVAGEGNIEMIRKTIDGKVEEFPIMGNRLIDGNGVWCYSIPMNLDYMTTDEFGNLVPTDDPNKGIATRTRVRFRFTMDDTINDASARKRAKYLVPNNPRLEDEEFAITHEADFEFGSATREESFRDLFWNKVYTVKNYIPKIQKKAKETNRNHTGIKWINHYGDNNPMPYNSLLIKLTFVFRLICVITKMMVGIVIFINNLLSLFGVILAFIDWAVMLPANIIGNILSFGIFKFVKKAIQKLWRTMFYPIFWLLDFLTPKCINLSQDFCDDGINPVVYYPGCNYFLFNAFQLPGEKFGINFSRTWTKTTESFNKKQVESLEGTVVDDEDDDVELLIASNDSKMLFNCIENELAQSNDATSFTFTNDWVNGTLYAPLWFRKIKEKRSYLFGLIKRPAKDDWCTSDRRFSGMRLFQSCSLEREKDGEFINYNGNPRDIYRVRTKGCSKKNKCQKNMVSQKGLNGVITPKLNMLQQTVYYYAPVQYEKSMNNYNGEVKLLFATDIVLLGSLNECDIHGIPQFFKSLESTTYKLPSDILFSDYEFTINTSGERQKEDLIDVEITSEMAGCDWGNPNEFDKAQESDSGLFYNINCFKINMIPKSCVNLSRICEFGVSLDETKFIPDLKSLETNEDAYEALITDGYISYDELYNIDERSMFATMNSNKLKTKLNSKTGFMEYDLHYLYPENFDGSLRDIMENGTKRYNNEINYKNNYKLETTSKDYYHFRMGENPFYYDDKHSFPRYENSFYFYFGLKAGKTAIDKFNSMFFSECTNPDEISESVGIRTKTNSWCSELNNENDGFVGFDLSKIDAPYDLLINGVTDLTYSLEVKHINDEKIYISNKTIETDIYTYMKDYVKLDGVPMMKNGTYMCVVTDANGQIIEFTFELKKKYLNFNLNAQRFTQPMNALLKEFGSYEKIAKDIEEVSSSDIKPDDDTMVTRKIGGVVTIYDLFDDEEQLMNYRIEIRPREGTKVSKSYSGVSFNVFDGKIEIENIPDELLAEGNLSIIVEEGVEAPKIKFYGIGLPCADIFYSITVTQLCQIGEKGPWVDSENSVTKEINVTGPLPYKLFINDIDHDLIKNFKDYTGWNVNNDVKIGEDSPTNVGKITMNGKKEDFFYNNDEQHKNNIQIDNNPWFNLDDIFKVYDYSNIDSFYVKWIYDDDGNSVLDDNGNPRYEIWYLSNEDDKNESDGDESSEDDETESDGNANNENSENVESDDDESGEDGETETNSKEKKVTEDELNKLFKEFKSKGMDDDDTIYGKNEIIKNICYTWCDDYVIDEYVSIDELTFDEIESYIDRVNEVMTLRKELPNKMKETFFITCEGGGKTFNFTVQTEDRPSSVTTVYAKEITKEVSEGFSDEKTLYDEDNVKGFSDMFTENITSITGVMVPTISYNSSPKYGTDTQNFGTCYGGVDGIVKLPYFVGCMNNAKLSIPTDANGKSLESEKIDDIFYLKSGITENDLTKGVSLKDLFSFPVIDKLLTSSYVTWSFFNGLPKYRSGDSVCGIYEDNEIVYMHGLHSGYVINGTTDAKNKYKEQTLFGLELMLYHLKKEANSYVDRSFYNGYDYKKILQWFLKYIGINIPNLPEDDDSIKEIIDNFLSFTNYKVEKVLDKKGNEIEIKQQYSPVIPAQTTLDIRSQDDCGLSDTIYGNLAVRLKDTSVNNCMSGEKVFEVALGKSSYEETIGDKFYVLSAFKRNSEKEKPDLTKQSDSIYPLNKAEQLKYNGINIPLWRIEDKIYKKDDNDDYITYYATAPTNIFSYYTTDDNLKELAKDGKYGVKFEGSITYTFGPFTREIKRDYSLYGEVVTENEEGDETITNEVGFSNNGKFNGNIAFPIFVVGEKDKNQRTISPVYDYSNVTSSIGLGQIAVLRPKLETDEEPVLGTDGKQICEPILDEDNNPVLDEEGNEMENCKTQDVNKYSVEETYSYAFAVKVNKGHYYLDNYPYTLKADIFLSSSLILNINEIKLYESNKYVFYNIDENMYTEWANILGIGDDNGIDFSSGDMVAKNTITTAVDVTTLKHITENNFVGEVKWYGYTWVLNLPKELEGTSLAWIDDGSGDKSKIYVEDIYEGNDGDCDEKTNDKCANSCPRYYDVGVDEELEGYRFLGWIEATDLEVKFNADKNGENDGEGVSNQENNEFVDFEHDDYFTCQKRICKPRIFFGVWEADEDREEFDVNWWDGPGSKQYIVNWYDDVQQKKFNVNWYGRKPE